jgi:hypothetical protein
LEWWKQTPDSHWVLYPTLAFAFGAFATAVGYVVGPWLWASPTADAFEKVTSGIGSLITAFAVIIGGYWAWFKFVRGRTFVARLSIELDGQWRHTDGMTVLHVRVRVRNIGASKVALNQFGSGLQVGFPYGAWYHRVEWDKIRWDEGAEPDKPCRFKVLKDHTWIEPGETVADELLLHLEGVRRRFCVLELTMVTALSEKHLGEYCPTDTENFARRIVAPDDRLLDRVK